VYCRRASEPGQQHTASLAYSTCSAHKGLGVTTVAVTQIEYTKAEKEFSDARTTGLECLPAPADEQVLSEWVKAHGARHVVVGSENYSGALYQALEPGSVMARFGVGYDNVDLEKATQCGVLCTNTPGTLHDSVAEHTVALMLAGARHIPGLASATSKGQWTPQLGRELRGKTLAVIGCGAIGCRVARIASFGLGMNVVGCEVREVDVQELKRRFGFSHITKDFHKAVSNADVVSLHIAGTPDNRYFINSKRLAAMPKQALFVNTARGFLVDEIALFDALTSSAIAGACLDVTDAEPYRPAHPEKDLRALRNIIMTPHCASSTQEACSRMAQQALQNIRLAEEEQYDRMNLLNPQVIRIIGSERQQRAGP